MALTLADGWRLEGKAEGIAEGIAEGKVESMMTVLEARFGKIPVSLKKKLNTLRENDRVEKALILAATCNSLKEFQKGL